jgi:adenylate kinase
MLGYRRQIVGSLTGRYCAGRSGGETGGGAVVMVRVIMLSPPGAGKGTHSRWLTLQTGAAHISAGDLLRAEVERGSELGRQVAAYTERGDLVPDELIFRILAPAVVAAARHSGGYVLDGFPRTMPQALRAAQFGADLALTSNAVIYLTAPEEELISRLLDRAQRDGRADDTLAVIRHRLAVFAKETAPLVDYYRDRGILLELSTDRPEPEVQADLQDWLQARGLLLSAAGESRPDHSAPAGARAAEDL